MTKESYSQRQQILMRRLIKLHTKPIYLALQSQMKAAADYIRTLDTVRDISVEHSPLNTEIEGAVIELYKDASKMAKKNYMLVKRFGGASDFINRVLDYLKQFMLSKVVEPISNTTSKIINNIINQSISEGWGVEKTAKYLETAPITKIRARMIIRTESVRATNFTQWMMADDEVYQMEKSWISVEDRRTRTFAKTGGRADHTHNGVDGETQDLKAVFSNGLQYPGDPNGTAADVINCRCTMSYRVKRDLNDRPIKK